MERTSNKHYTLSHTQDFYVAEEVYIHATNKVSSFFSYSGESNVIGHTLGITQANHNAH